MQTNRFTDEPIIRIMREGDAGATWTEVIRRHEVSKESFQRGRATSCSLEPAEAKRLKTRAERMHGCPRGYVAHCGVNAARHVLARAREATGRTGPSASRPACRAAA